MSDTLPATGVLLYDPDCGICQKAAGVLTHLGLDARVQAGPWHEGSSHRTEQTCASDVDLDINIRVRKLR